MFEDMSQEEIQDKIGRYDELVEENESLKREVENLKAEARKFILAMEKHWQEIEAIKDMPQEDMDAQTLRSKKLGYYQGSNLGLRMQIRKFKHLISIL